MGMGGNWVKNGNIETKPEQNSPGLCDYARGRTVLRLVRRARRRLITNELFAQGATAASAALLAFVVLLLLGTEVLDWHWTLSIALAAIALGLYGMRKRVPSEYASAQLVDRRLGFADTLSTALFFSRREPPAGSEEMCRLQRQTAEELAARADVRRAVPFTMPRGAYAAAGLALVAFSLGGLRYGLNRRLDLKEPLARILQQTFGFETKTALAKNQVKRPDVQPQPNEDPETVQDRQQNSGDRQDDSANTAEDPNSQQPSTQSKKAAPQQQGQQTAKAESGEKDGNNQDGEDSNGDSSAQSQQAKNSRKQDAGGRNAADSGENSSLMSKVKDAVQNLLSRMKPQQGQQNSLQATDQKNSQGKGQQSPSKQQASRDRQQQNGGQQGDSQDGQSSEQAQNSQDPQGRGTGKSDSAQASKQPGSGIGSQDGDKNIKQAEQLAAMGKISEILGKRSATISGESTVEVQNTSQVLRTPYAQRGIQHTQGGAEINRDEVPVALQAFVAHYFEQVRKQKK
jgi:hypothetical protein